MLGCLDALRGFTSGSTGLAIEQVYDLDRVSPQTLSAIGSSHVRQSCDSHVCLFFFFGFKSSAAFVWLVVGLDWFGSTVSGFLLSRLGSDSEVQAGRQAVSVGLAVWLVDVNPVGQSRVCFKTVATAGGHVDCDAKHFFEVCSR